MILSQINQNKSKSKWSFDAVNGVLLLAPAEETQIGRPKEFVFGRASFDLRWTDAPESS